MLDVEVAEFAGADAGVEEQVDDGLVADAGGPGVGAFAFAGAGVGAGGLAEVEHGLNVVLGEGDDGALFGPGAGYGADDVLVGEALFGGPGPARGEGGVDVEDGFFGEGFGGTGGDAGGGDGSLAEVGEEGVDLLGGDLIEEGVAEEPVEDVLVGVEGVGGELLGAFLQDESLDGLG